MSNILIDMNRILCAACSGEACLTGSAGSDKKEGLQLWSLKGLLRGTVLLIQEGRRSVGDLQACIALGLHMQGSGL